MHNRVFRFFLSIAAITLMAPVLAGSPCDVADKPGSAWTLSARTPLATIYHPVNTAGSPPAALVRIQWDSDPGLLYETIRDYAHFADFIPNVVRSRVVAEQTERVWVYQQLHLPGPARDRHYIIVSTHNDSKPAPRRYHVKWELSTRYPLPDSEALVMPRHFRGCWTISTGKQNGLSASYWIELDPGGWLPHWLAQAALNQYISDLMNALHQRISSAPDNQH